MLSRRLFLLSSALLPTAFTEVERMARRQKFFIGACDWSLGKAASPKAFEVAKQIGLDGVQVSYNSQKDETWLANPANIQKIKEASERTGVKIASLAIGELNRVPYKSEPRTEAWVSNAIDAAKALKVKVILLAFFSKNDLRNDDAGKQIVIERLKKVAPKAEKFGITLAIESYLSAQEHIDIINSVGSKAVKVYYDFCNATDAGYDIYQEIPLLGKDLICEIHMKENGFLLGKGSLDWQKIQAALHDIGYKGWMQIEGATPPKANILESYRQNLQFLKEVFAD